MRTDARPRVIGALVTFTTHALCTAVAAAIWLRLVSDALDCPDRCDGPNRAAANILALFSAPLLYGGAFATWLVLLWALLRPWHKREDRSFSIGACGYIQALVASGVAVLWLAWPSTVGVVVGVSILTVAPLAVGAMAVRVVAGTDPFTG